MAIKSRQNQAYPSTNGKTYMMTALKLNMPDSDTSLMQATTALQPVHCACGRRVFDGEVITARAVRVVPRLVAKCRCKRWVLIDQSSNNRSINRSDRVTVA